MPNPAINMMSWGPPGGRSRLQLEGVRARLGDVVGDEGFLVGGPSGPQCPWRTRSDRDAVTHGVRLKVVGEQLAVRDTGRHHKRREKNVFHESRILCVGFPRQNRWRRHESRTLHHEMGRQRAQNVFRRGLRWPGALRVEGQRRLEDMPKCPVNEWIGQEVRVSLKGSSIVWRPAKSSEDLRGGLVVRRVFEVPLACPSIIRPELSRIHEGIALRDEAWERANHLAPHVVYLSQTSHIKVG